MKIFHFFRPAVGQRRTLAMPSPTLAVESRSTSRRGLPEQAGIERLRREIQKLGAERDILKSPVYFAKDVT